MKNLMNIGVVNFHAIWGDKQTNLQNIIEYSEAAGKRGCDLLLLPETALTGYDDDTSTTIREEKMHDKLAETIPGPATASVAEIAKKYGMYIVFGMAELDAGKVYNSAAIIHPDGKTQSYRKLHLPFSEGNWAVRGEDPVLIDTPWGPVGIAICYDVYCFPELIRYSRARGARLFLNVTASPINECTATASELTVNAYSYINYIYIASANLCGLDNTSWFPGGSCVVGPESNPRGATFPRTFIGTYFNQPDCDVPGLKLGTIDLDHADEVTQIPIFRCGPSGRPDYRPELYKQMMEDIIANPYWTNVERK